MTKNGIENKSTDYLLEILIASNVPVFVTNALAPEHPIVFVNDAFELATGFSVLKSIGRKPFFLQPNENLQHDIQEFEHALNEGRPYQFTLKQCRHDGSQLRHHFHFYPLRNAAGTVTHFIGLIHDLAKDQKLTLDLIQLKIDIEQADHVLIESAAN